MQPSVRTRLLKLRSSSPLARAASPLRFGTLLSVAGECGVSDWAAGLRCHRKNPGRRHRLHGGSGVQTKDGKLFLLLLILLLLLLLLPPFRAAAAAFARWHRSR